MSKEGSPVHQVRDRAPLSSSRLKSFPRGPKYNPVDNPMVKLTHLNGREFVVNVDVVATLEATPDTVVTLTNGTKLLVKEKIEEVIDRAVGYRRRIVEGTWT